MRDERVARRVTCTQPQAQKRDPPKIANGVPSTLGSMPYPAPSQLTAECTFQPRLRLLRTSRAFNSPGVYNSIMSAVEGRRTCMWQTSVGQSVSNQLTCRAVHAA